jgi:hypothetical protein
VADRRRSPFGFAKNAIPTPGNFQLSPAGTTSARTYAIGFGLPADVSAPVLNEITSNTHGDLIITGNIATAEQGFDLTKYFVQILAGVSNMNVLLDPQGSLFLGSEQLIPFDVTHGDVYIDVIALCPIPQILEFRLQTPSGTIIDSGTADPNVTYTVRPEVAFYRVVLPALASDPAGSYNGTWKAILGLTDKGKIDHALKDDDVAAQRNHLIGRSLPCSLVAHAYSNVNFDAAPSAGELASGRNRRRGSLAQGERRAVHR